jgi:sugar lactone lactonase YvrE
VKLVQAACQICRIDYEFGKTVEDVYMDFELAIDSRIMLAETPIWDSRINKLYFTDLFEGTVHRYDPQTGTNESVETNSLIGSAVPCDIVDKLLVAVEDGMMILDFNTGEMELVVTPEPNTGEFRYNDTRCDPAGRIFTSSVSRKYGSPEFDPETMSGKFYMIDTDGSVVVLVDKIAQYNCIVFDSACQNLYVVDTYNHKLLRFDYSIEKGAGSSPEVVIQFDDMPDGASVDSEDNVYICHWSDKRHITVWSLKDYSLIKNILFPVKHICCGGFAGRDMKDYYVATSKFWLPDGDPDFDVGAGGIFKARVDIAGNADYFYKI